MNEELDLKCFSKHLNDILGLDDVLTLEVE